MKAVELFDNVDYDYPACGGYVITDGSKYLTIEHQSNYTGNKTGDKCKLLSTSPTAIAIKNEIENDELDLEYIRTLSFVGGYIVE